MLKFTLSGAPVWRLVALDGKADLAHVSMLLCAAFGYRGLDCSFEAQGAGIPALVQGAVPSQGAMETLDSLIGRTSGAFSFLAWSGQDRLSHAAQLMRSDEKLACLMPSCIVGSGAVPPSGPYTLEAISAFAQDDSNLELNIKEITNRMRRLGSVRQSLEAALGEAGVAPIPFKEQ
ncbi:MAG: hypothetical protein ACI4NA_01545 [Succinivibrio sp.]